MPIGLDEGLADRGGGDGVLASRITRLALLTPDIVEVIFAGTLTQSVVLDRLEKGVAVDWEKQRAVAETSESALRMLLQS